MRQAIVEVIGSLIIELANVEGEDQADPKQTQKQISNLFNLLLERVLDNSSYVRSKVFAVLAKLVKIKPTNFRSSVSISPRRLLALWMTRIRVSGRQLRVYWSSYSSPTLTFCMEACYSVTYGRMNITRQPSLSTRLKVPLEK